MCARQLLPGEPHRFLDDEFGDVRQPIAHFHQRQAPGEIRVGDAKHSGPLKLAQCFDFPLRIVVRYVLTADHEFIRELRTRQRLLEHTFIDELIEQQRRGCNLARKKIATPADVDEARKRACVLIEKRIVRRSTANRFEKKDQTP